jgi:hypothetical protein
LRRGVVELDEVLGQFETDVAVDEAPQLRGHDFEILWSDPTGAHEPHARLSNVRVGAPEGRPNVRSTVLPAPKRATEAAVRHSGALRRGELVPLVRSSRHLLPAVG